MCRTSRNDKNEITEVRAANGQPSNLFLQYYNLTSDYDLAMEQYLEMLTRLDKWDDLVVDENNEPVLKELDTKGIAFFEFMDPDTPKYKPFIDSNKRRKIKLQRELSKIQKKIDNSADVTVRATAYARLEVIKLKIADANHLISQYKDTDRLDPFKTALASDKRTLKTILRDSADPTLHELEMAKEIIDFWNLVGNYSVEEHPFFDSIELEAIQTSDSTVDRNGNKAVLDHAIGEMQSYSGMLNKHFINIITDRAKSVYGPSHEISWDTFLEDITGVEALFLDISQTNNEVLQMLQEAVSSAAFDAKTESNRLVKEVDNKVAALRPWAAAKGMTLIQAFNTLRQTFSNEHKEETGNMLVLQTYEWDKELRRKRDWSNKQTTDKKIKKAEENRFDQYGWEQLNTRVVNGTTFKNSEAYAKHLINLVGNEKIAQDLQRKANILLADYHEQMLSYEAHINNQNIDASSKKYRLRKFEFENSPIVHENILTKGYMSQVRKFGLEKSTDSDFPRVSGKYTVTIPNKKSDMDTAYQDLHNSDNAPLLDMYEYSLAMIKEVTAYLPDYKTRRLMENTMPFMLENFVNDFSANGMAHAAKSTWTNFQKSLRVDNVEESTYRLKDANGQLSDEVQVRYIRGQKQIDNFIDLEMAKWMSVNIDRDRSTPEFRKDYKAARLTAERIITDKIAKEQTFDLGQVLKAYTLFGLNYKHKTHVEDLVRAVSHVVDVKNQEAPLNGEAVSEERIGNIKSQLRAYNDAFFNYRPEDKAFVHKKQQIVTKEEKAQKEQINDIIVTLDNDIEALTKEMNADHVPDETRQKLLNKITGFTITRDKLQMQHDKIGGAFKSSTVIDKLLKMTRFKGMAFNVSASVNNISFGLISIANQAADGRVYSDKHVSRAFLISMNAVSKNYQFNKQIPGTYQKDVTDKLRSIMNNLDVLKETKYEIFNKSDEGNLTRLTEKAKWIDPYGPQARSEYFIQSIDLISTALATVVTLSNGEVTNMWDAMTVDMELPMGATITTSEGRDDIVISAETHQQGLFYLKQRVDKVIRENHGNYDPNATIKAKRHALGRMASLFHTWMFEGTQSRWGRHRVDKQFGFERKGRYRTGIAVPFTPVMFSWSNDTGMDWMEQTLTASKYLLNAYGRTLGLGRLGILTKPDLEAKGYSSVDAANLRKNVRDAQFQMILAAIFFLIKAAATGEKEEREEDDIPANEKGGKEQLYNYLANTALRVHGELTLYLNPIQVLNSPKNFTTMARTLGDWAHVLVSLGEQFGSEPEYAAGPFKEQNKFKVRLMHAIPGVSNYPSYVKQKDKIYGNPLLATLGLK